MTWHRFFRTINLMTRWEYKVLKLETESSFFTGTEFDESELESLLDPAGGAVRA